MSWNRPSSSLQPPPKKSAPPTLKRGLLAGAIIVLLGAAALLLFRPSAATPKREAPKDRGLIKEVTPAAAPKAELDEKPVVKKRSRVEEDRMRGCYTNEMGYVINRPTTAVVYTNDTALNMPKSLADRIFSNPADRKIGNMLLVPPGTTVVGELPKSAFGKSFERSFLKSIASPELVLHDDPPDVAELKRAVLEAKAELKARYDAGEDIGEIMRNERHELQMIGLYRNDLEKELKKIVRQKDLSREDVEDFVTAANRLLADRGAEPLKMPAMAIRRFKIAEGPEDKGKDPEK